jgi:hypothetical protein
LTQTFLRGAVAAVHRIDLPCERTGFSTPPSDVHIKFLPSSASGDGWTLLARAAAGKPDVLARWLRPHPGIEQVRVAPGIAPKLLRAKVVSLPPEWATVASFAKVHHLDLAADGHASWFIEGVRDRIWALVQHLELTPDSPLAPTEVRCRPVHGGRNVAPISRRQFEALSAAVALGYYDIPHRLDLRTLAARTGISLGSVSELLRRAEGAVLTHYVDSSLMSWPAMDEEGSTDPFMPMDNMLRH